MEQSAQVGQIRFGDSAHFYIGGNKMGESKWTAVSLFRQRLQGHGRLFSVDLNYNAATDSRRPGCQCSSLCTDNVLSKTQE